MRRMLLVVNPHASAMSARRLSDALALLRGGFAIEVVQTEAQGHARQLAAAGADAGMDLIGAFGGDGTANEVANGISEAQTGTGSGAAAGTCALAVVPAGQANVLARMLGMPMQTPAACEYLLVAERSGAERVIDLGCVNDRLFTFASGVGIDAEVTRAVDARPRLKARLGPWLYSWAVLETLSSRRGSAERRMSVVTEAMNGDPSRALEGVTTVIQNGDPYTYFRRLPVNLARDAALDSGSLAGCVLHEARAADVPQLAYRALAGRAAIGDHRQVSDLGCCREITVSGQDQQSLPLHVDGDFIGMVRQARFAIRPGALRLLA